MQNTKGIKLDIRLNANLSDKLQKHMKLSDLDKSNAARALIKEGEALALKKYTEAKNCQNKALDLDWKMYKKAEKLFNECESYLDSTDCAKKCADMAESIKDKQYSKAIELHKRKQDKEAVKIFSSLEYYKDSAELAEKIFKDLTYLKLVDEMNHAKKCSEYLDLKIKFENLGDYKDSKQKASECEEKNWVHKIHIFGPIFLAFIVIFGILFL
jgi:hypothetical protein